VERAPDYVSAPARATATVDEIETLGRAAELVAVRAAVSERKKRALTVSRQRPVLAKET
jgi:hypothetical protein